MTELHSPQPNLYLESSTSSTTTSDSGRATASTNASSPSTASGSDSSPAAATAPKEPWTLLVAKAAAADTRTQPWKEALGKSHDNGMDGQDLINLNLPNFVQCGSLAA